MRFWELDSVMREDRGVLYKVLAVGKWEKFHNWQKNIDTIVKSQQRDILDYEVPDELCREVFAATKILYCLHNGRLRVFNKKNKIGDETVITALEAFDRFGGWAMEEAREYGSVDITDPEKLKAEKAI